MSTPHRKRVRHYHEPGDIHELTFSCYRRMPLLTNNAWRIALSRSIDAAGAKTGGQLAAFVYMPEHVHLLVGNFQHAEDVSEYLSLLKQPVSSQAHEDLARVGSSLLEKLMVRERPGKTTFRFWQEGPGFDANFSTAQSVQNAIDYIHRNPVERELAVKARDWRWSSCRFYESEGREVDAELPKIIPLPAEFWSGP